MELTERNVYATARKHKLPTPVRVVVTSSEITIVWLGNHEGLAGSMAQVMQQEDMNYPDPTPNTNDITIVIDSRPEELSRYQVVYRRVSKEEHEAYDLDTPIGD